MRYLLILLLLVGCASKPMGPIRVKFPLVHKQVRPYVHLFNKYYKIYRHSELTDTLIVKMDVILESDQADGVYYTDKDFTIVSSEYWNYESNIEKIVLVFHELGHHVLKRIHDWSERRMMKDGCPRSIMYYQGVSESCFTKHGGNYIKELFLER